jgi:predicted CopG family antitoxin
VQKKLTITIDEQVYEGLHRVVGRRRISHFIETLVRPHLLDAGLDEGYRLMAADEEQEAEAHDWIEATIGDVVDESR